MSGHSEQREWKHCKTVKAPQPLWVRETFIQLAPDEPTLTLSEKIRNYQCVGVRLGIAKVRTVRYPFLPAYTTLALAK